MIVAVPYTKKGKTRLFYTTPNEYVGEKIVRVVWHNWPGENQRLPRWILIFQHHDSIPQVMNFISPGNICRGDTLTIDIERGGLW